MPTNRSRCSSVSTPSAVSLEPERRGPGRRSPGRSRRRPCWLELADEGAVDLDLVDREAAQVAQRGIAGAEIVERDAEAGARSWPMRVAAASRSLDQDALGDLELEPARARARLGERCASTLARSSRSRSWTGETLTATRAASGQRCASRRPSRSTQSPSRSIMPHSSAIGMKMRRRDQAARRMVPAHQRLDADDRAAGDRGAAGR